MIKFFVSFETELGAFLDVVVDTFFAEGVLAVFQIHRIDEDIETDGTRTQTLRRKLSRSHKLASDSHFLKKS